MSEPLLLCTDLDRTLLPNGAEPESPMAREYFRVLVALDRVTLAYVSGRDRARVEDAVARYRLPAPDHVVADVGTTIYRVEASHGWQPEAGWEDDIGRDWAGVSHASLAARLADLAGLSLQEPSRQGRFKLSYEVDLDVDREALLAAVRERLRDAGVRPSVVWSVDEGAGVGLLDVLPARATKLHAIEYLMRRHRYTPSSTLFAGDSGNDLEVLASAVPSVLVANASEAVRVEARAEAARRGHHDALYEARGGFLGMNGNYAAGILEGVAHYHPALGERLRAAGCGRAVS